jgi:hypothetical protein
VKVNTIKGYSVEQLTSFFLSDKYGGMLRKALEKPIRLHLLNKIDCSDARILAYDILQAYECDPLFSDLDWLTLFFDTLFSMHCSERSLREYRKRTSAELYPALELAVCSERFGYRDWNQRWTCAGDSCQWKGASKETLVAHVTSPIWKNLGNGVGGFENDCLRNPFPPFALGANMMWLQVGNENLNDYGLHAPIKKTRKPTKGEIEIYEAIKNLGPNFEAELFKDLYG